MPPNMLCPQSLDAVKRAVEFLAERQRSDGEFETPMSWLHRDSEEQEYDSSPFATSLILHSLRSVGGERSQAIIQRGLEFLQTVVEPAGWVRYWTRRSEKHAFIPPDVDDTCCVSHVLASYGLPVPDNRSLILGNRDSRGAFHTWILPRRVPTANGVSPAVNAQLTTFLDHEHPFWQTTEAEANDIDAAVNANVVMFLGDLAETQGACRYLNQIIMDEAEECADKWYLGRYPLYYLISRAFAGGVHSLEPSRGAVIGRLLEMPRHAWADLNPLQSALAACTMINFGYEGSLLTDLTEGLLNGQATDGSWPRHILYTGGPEHAVGWGSRELTTAFCVEALARFEPKRC